MLARRAGRATGWEPSTSSATATRRGTCTGSSSGLESMIVGEAEIQGQVKRAYERALAARTTGPLTNKLFRAALATGKRVRTETTISAGHASVASVAVDAARAPVGELADAPRRDRRRGRHVRADRARVPRPRRDDDVRRQPPARPGDRAGRSASAAPRAPSTRCPSELERADVVVSSTASPHAIIEAEELAAVMDGARAAGRCCSSTSPCRATSIRRAPRSTA